VTGAINMDPFLLGTLAIIGLFVLLAMGFHIGLALIMTGFAGMLVLRGFETTLVMVVNSFYFKISNPALVTLPLFILMGHLASGGGISRDIYESLSLWLGKFRSGLGISTVLAATAFGTVCGSSIVTAAVFAKISAPEMRRQGYGKSMAYAICGASGAIGMLIPPSMLAIVYGTLSGLSIGKVLMAGVAPGVLLTVTFSLTIIVMGKIKPSLIATVTTERSISWKERFISLKAWWSVVLVGFVLFGGMYGGVFSPTEAASVAAFLLMLVYFFKIALNRTASGRKEMIGEFWYCFKETAITSGLIFIVFGGATVFSQFIVLTGATSELSHFIINSGVSPQMLVIIFTCVYLVLGIFLDGISILCITVPVLNPIINAAGVDPIWYATIAILSIEVGLITPPVGLNLYAAKGVAEPDVSLEDIIRGIFPFFAAMIISLIILYLFPPMSTFLPSFIG